MTFTRLQTSRSMLQIAWQRAPGANAYGIQGLDDALAAIAVQSGGKPVLINRESEAREPKVAKLYQEALKSERFALASRWPRAGSTASRSATKCSTKRTRCTRCSRAATRRR